MKFARYLNDTQTPEWKRAYIDYRSLKKCIGAIRAEHIARLNTTGTTDIDQVYKEAREHEEYNGSSSRASSQEIPLSPKTVHSPLMFPFFRDADSELEKVDSFYAEREKEMRDRGKLLKEQLNELGLHRKKYYESNANVTGPSWARRVHLRLAATLLALVRCRTDKSDNQPASESYRGETGYSITTGDGGTSECTTVAPAPASIAGDSTQVASLRSNRSIQHTKANGNVPLQNNNVPFTSPQEYQNAEKRLKKAVVEYYRGLEALNNYRILNLTGFRKAVKKYEKITQIPAQAAYMKEKVEPSAFASSAMVSSMLKEMEELFAARFERGDKKKAVTHLRVGATQKSYHFSTFCTGVLLGSSIPATVIGFVACLRDSTATPLHSWNIILYIYSILLIPILLALLVGLNLVVWARERINYVFIFELNVRSRLDHREYFEVWHLGILFLLSYYNILWGHSRWWLIKGIARLCVSGLCRVEFTDFWLGFSNLYFIGCFYSRYFPYVPSDPNASSTSGSLLGLNTSMTVVSRFFSSSQMSSLVPRDEVKVWSAYDPAVQDAWKTCGPESHWGSYFVLAMIPFLLRLMQSVRRYKESKLPTHLINAGKYGMGTVNYLCYYLWKRDGGTDGGASFMLWCLSAVIYSLYGCAWDFAMDWSICKPRAKYPLLRRELVYTSQIPLYYVAMAMNFFIRFLWVFYIPSWPYFNIRSFVTALMEMTRRIMWNFYRLENEHLGNMDQYRITREVPLPYSFDNPQNEDDDDEDKV
ncbi:EXS-domain-containing protein [Suillus decipiens]|nr:EXS-domain-containing protein [Suillus decipiens]